MKLFRLFVVACILTFCAGRAAAQEQETPAPKTYKIYAVCDAHLDTQWNWDLTHTIREYIPRILFQNLWMLERYPDYKFNFEGGHHLPMDEGVLSAALRPFAEVYRRGALAHQRRVVECQRPQHAFGRVVHPQHPARTGALQARVRRAFDRHLPARLLRVRVHAAFAGGPLRPDRFLDPEAELAQARLLPRRTLSQEKPLLVGRMVRYRRAVAHGGLRYGRVYRRTAGRRGV